MYPRVYPVSALLKRKSVHKPIKICKCGNETRQLDGVCVPCSNGVTQLGKELEESNGS